MSLGIAISTATILAEQLAAELIEPFEITRSILDKFSDGMLIFQKELENQFQLRSMDNILSKGELSIYILTVFFSNNVDMPIAKFCLLICSILFLFYLISYPKYY